MVPQTHSGDGISVLGGGSTSDTLAEGVSTQAAVGGSTQRQPAHMEKPQE